MNKPTDEELIEEIRRRFEFNQNALDDMRAMTRKLEQVNEKLQESEALKSQFLSNIRNEINNPLSAIMGLAAQFFDHSCDPEVCRNTIRMIYAEAFNLDYQLQNVFMAAELEAGDTEPAIAMVEISSVLKSCLDKLGYRISDKDLSVSRHIPEDLIFPTDAQKIEIILLNLLGNAAEFTERGGLITLEVEENKQGLVVSVTDTGPGVSAADQEVIFDRFRQLEAGTTKGHRGHGLGLSICWALTELLGGVLDLDSEPGQGCRFVLSLPRPDVETVVHAAEGNFFIFDNTEGEVETF
jgi:signal transduction histidine kinase